MKAVFSSLNGRELKIFRKLNTPQKIQDFLERLPINFEKRGETCFSPRMVLKENKAHCFEGALFAAAILWFHGQKPLLLDLKTTDDDEDHTLALFQKNGHWGAISKTNHTTLRYRDPVYRDVKELVMSYFNEYYLEDGKKTLRSYSTPFDLRKFKDKNWVTSEEGLWYLNDALDSSLHRRILNHSARMSLRKVSKLERRALDLVEFGD